MRKLSKNIFLLALMFIVIGVSISIYNITFATEEKSNDKETGLDAVNNSENKLVFIITDFALKVKGTSSKSRKKLNKNREIFLTYLPERKSARVDTQALNVSQ